MPRDPYVTDCMGPPSNCESGKRRSSTADNWNPTAHKDYIFPPSTPGTDKRAAKETGKYDWKPRVNCKDYMEAPSNYEAGKRGASTTDGYDWNPVANKDYNDPLSALGPDKRAA